MDSSLGENMIDQELVIIEAGEGAMGFLLLSCKYAGVLCTSIND